MKLAVVAVLVLGTGCMGASGGNVDASNGTDGHATHDGGNPDGAQGNPDAAGFACKNKVTSGLTSGHHNAGQDCMNCHGFTLAGTLYSSTGTAVAGGSITVKDANGHSFDLVSQNNGNFYTSQSVSFPVTVVASECPAVQMMTATVPNGAGCNGSSCHGTGAAQGHVHL